MPDLKTQLDEKITELQNYYRNEGYQTFQNVSAVQTFIDEMLESVLHGEDINVQQALKTMLDHIISKYPEVWDTVQSDAIEDATEIVQEFDSDPENAGAIRNFFINEFGQGVQTFLKEEVFGE